MSDTKRFTMKDEPFKCIVCGYNVEPLRYTARDHCPNCLSSIHVDNFPGDRLSSCHGILKPIGIEKAKDKFKIVYKCEKCGMIHNNIQAIDDNMDLIIKLSVVE